MEEISNEFALNASSFSTLGSLDALAYAVIQIPLGIMVDKIGIKKTILASIILCILGSVIFATAEYFWLIQLSRILTGLGSASSFMCTLKFISDRFPPNRRALLMGLTLSLGVGGAITANKGISFLLQFENWHTILYLAAALGSILLLFNYLLVPNYKAHNSNIIQINALLSDLLSLVKNKQIWKYSFLSSGFYVPLAILAELWGIAFLKKNYQISQTDAAHLASLLYIGLGIGSIIIPWLAEKKKAMNQTLFICCLINCLSLLILLYQPHLSYLGASCNLLILGFFSGAEIICFSGALLHNDKNHSGEIIGIVNTINMLSVAFFKYLAGLILDLTNTFTSSTSYSLNSYVMAFLPFILMLLICAFVVFKMLLETKNS